MDVSKAFWSCRDDILWPSSLDICAFMLEVFGLLANAKVSILLLLLRTKKFPEDLTLLRVLSVSCFVSTLVSFISDVVAASPDTGSALFDSMVCVLWSTGFIYWFSKAIVYYSLFFFAFNRAFEILQLKRHPLITERQRLAAYLVLVFLCAFLATAPLLLLAQPHVKNCACAPPTKNLAILTVVYAKIFLWVALLGIICPAILVYISVALLLRLRRTERGRHALVDDLEQLAFSDPSSSASSITDTSSVQSLPVHPARPCEGEEVSARHVWSASFCIIPLTVAYIATFSYDAIYQTLSAAGYLTYVMHSAAQKFSELLSVLFTDLVPLIIFFHIPAMRSLIFVRPRKEGVVTSD